MKKTGKVKGAKIDWVKVKISVDQYYPYDDAFGTFDREPKSDFAINHHRRQGRRDRNSLPWFNPACTGDRAAAEADYIAVMSFINEERCMMKAVVTAQVTIPCGEGELTAPVDAFGADGFDNTDHPGRENAVKEAEEGMAGHLKTLGFSDREVANAMSQAEEVDD